MAEDFDPIAALDQVLRGLMDMARIMHAYYSALCEQGFEPSEALSLTVAYQSEFLRADNDG